MLPTRDCRLYPELENIRESIPIDNLTTAVANLKNSAMVACFAAKRQVEGQTKQRQSAQPP